jgi:hypothetical protein
MFMVFVAGFVVCANISRLIPVNPNYESSWYKVGFAEFLGVVFSVCALGEARKEE